MLRGLAPRVHDRPVEIRQRAAIVTDDSMSVGARRPVRPFNWILSRYSRQFGTSGRGRGRTAPGLHTGDRIPALQPESIAKERLQDAMRASTVENRAGGKGNARISARTNHRPLRFGQALDTTAARASMPNVNANQLTPARANGINATGASREHPSLAFGHVAPERHVFSAERARYPVVERRVLVPPSNLVPSGTNDSS